MERFWLAAVQLDTQADFAENLRQAAYWIEEAAQRGAKIVVLPETMEYIGENMAEQARENAGVTQKALQQLAAKHGIYLHGGSITEWNDAGKPFNTAMLFLPDGTTLCKYRKLHLFDVRIGDGPSCQESDGIFPGNELVLAKTRLAALGFSICYDLRFPELYRLLALHGAQVLCVSANFTLQTGKDHWEPLLRARAIENGCYVAAAGQIGRKHSFQAYGKTMIIDPWGNIVAQASDEPGYCMAEIDLARLERIRAQLPSLQNRRADLYRLDTQRLAIYEEAWGKA